MSVSNAATAADQTRAGQPGCCSASARIPASTGQGIGVAIVDSGIAPHSALANKVVANVSFVTGDSSPDDDFGHGTHVAGIIAGAASPASVTPLYNGGIAPGAQADQRSRARRRRHRPHERRHRAASTGSIANSARYNIRVINLSLGHPVTESCVTDPLCEAVGRANLAAASSSSLPRATADSAPTAGRVLGGITVAGQLAATPSRSAR